jgi:hypothetical protein
MIKSELQNLLNQINNTNTVGSESIYEYISLVKQCVEKLQTLQQEDKSPMLDAWITMGLTEIRKDLTGRLGNDFKNLSQDRQKTEFMYSKSTVSMALTNILMNI